MSELASVLVGRHVLVAGGHVLTVDALGELLVDDLILVDGLLTLVHLLGCCLGLLTETGLHLLLSLNQALTLWCHLLTGLQTVKVCLNPLNHLPALAGIVLVQRAGNPKAETFGQLSVIVELSRLGLDHQGVPLLLTHKLLIGRGLPVKGYLTALKALQEVGSTRTLNDVVKGPDDDLLCLSVARDTPGLKCIINVALEELAGLRSSQNGRVLKDT
ncbi:glycosyl transferase family 1 protein [Klebsiella phage KN3-1]|uniref:Glycosyl transferase family 1 protein n=1 Tax=Klebsiella phage KN3-1 TaxID=2282630 RepID=A0A3T0ZBX1_BPK31|nr:glycosyl transferase family 1 protein [Klebsiella phage KN3-1]BBF66865.1 glycosyl transferase family 1 protein [Klebsiella phage KN3-1]